MSRFLDTSILLYSISTDPAEAAKRDVATALLDRDDNALSVQVLQEFYVQATRATRTNALSHDAAVGFIRTWLRFPIQEIDLTVTSDALAITTSSGLPYWDAAIIAAARARGCRELLSEDMGHGRAIDGVLIVDPFR
jgi:predicted nucleic acid-binding protein